MAEVERTAGVHRWRAGLALVAATATVSACGAVQKPATSGSLKTSVAEAVVRYLSPTSGSAFVAGQSELNGFVTRVAVKAIDGCLARGRWPALPPQPGPDTAGTYALPNLAGIESQKGFATQFRFGDPTRNMTASEKLAYARAVRRCEPVLPSLWFGSASAQRIGNQWMRVVSRLIVRSPEVLSANQRGAACSRGTAFPAATYESEEHDIYRRMNVAAQTRGKSYVRRIDAAGASIFVRCFGDAVRAVDRLLSARVESFRAARAEALERIESRTTAQIARLARRYQISFGVT